MNRLSKKSEKVIKEMVEGGRLFESPLSVMAREGARTMFRVDLEEEMMEALGRSSTPRRSNIQRKRPGFLRRSGRSTPLRSSAFLPALRTARPTTGSPLHTESA